MEIKFKAGYLSAVLLTAAVKDIRYYLNAVMFEVQNGTLFMVGSDGHRVSYARLDAEGVPDGRILLKREGLVAMLKGTKGHEEITLFADDPNNLGFRIGERGATVTGILAQEAGVFPDWRRFVPSRIDPDVADSSLTINPKYLADLAKAADHLVRTGNAGKAKPYYSVSLQSTSANGIIAATVSDVFDYAYLVMPMRADAAITLPSTRGGT